MDNSTILVFAVADWWPEVFVAAGAGLFVFVVLVAGWLATKVFLAKGKPERKRNAPSWRSFAATLVGGPAMALALWSCYALLPDGPLHQQERLDDLRLFVVTGIAVGVVVAGATRVSTSPKSCSPEEPSTTGCNECDGAAVKRKSPKRRPRRKKAAGSR